MICFIFFSVSYWQVGHVTGPVLFLLFTRFSLSVKSLTGLGCTLCAKEFPMGTRWSVGFNLGSEGPCKEQVTIFNGREEGISGIESGSKRIQD